MSATFFLSVRGDEEATRKELTKRKLEMVGEPCSAGERTTTVRVTAESPVLRSWMNESARNGTPPGALLSYSEDY